MPSYKKHILPPIITSDGEVWAVILENTNVYAQAAADTITYDQFSFWTGDIIHSDAFLTAEGRRQIENLSFAFYDRWDYSGTCNGSPVSEDLGAIHSSIRRHIFRDKSLKYTIVLAFIPASGVPEYFYAGSIDPLRVTHEEGPFNAEHSSTEQYKAICTVPTVSCAFDLGTATVQDLRGAITAADVRVESLFSGIIYSEFYRSGNAEFTRRMYTNPHSDYFRLAMPYNGHGTAEGLSDPTQYPVVWPPVGGTYVMLLGRLLEIAAGCAGIDFDASTDLASALEFFRQEMLDTNPTNGFDLDEAKYTWPLVAGTPVPVTEIYIPLNAYLGYHPKDGSDWDNPVRWKTGDKLDKIFTFAGNLLLCDWGIEVDQTTKKARIKFVPFGTSQGAFPKNRWVLKEGATQEETEIGPAQVAVSYTGDTLKVKAPANRKGQTLEISHPFRLHGFGRYDYVFGDRTDYGMSYHNGALPVLEQWKCFKVSNLDLSQNGSERFQKLQDCWPPFTYLYWLKTTTENDMYPEAWGQDENVGTEVGFAPKQYYDPGLGMTLGDWSGCYVIAAVAKAGDGIANPPPMRQTNLLEPQASAFAQRITGARTVLNRPYKNANLGADGLFRTPRAGMRDTWLRDGIMTEFEVVKLDRALIAREASTTWRTVEPLDIDISTEEDGTSSGSSSSSSSSSTSTGTTNDTTSESKTATRDDLTTLHRAVRRNVKFLSGGIVSKTLSMSIFEYYDGTAWIAQYGMSELHDPAEIPDTLGYNSLWLFNRHTTEVGNVWIEGLCTSPASSGHSDYFATAITVRRRSAVGVDTSVDHVAEHLFWSEDQNRFVVQRQLEKCNPRRRVYIDGRVKISLVAGVLTPTWVDLTTETALPHSDKETLTDSDFESLAGALNPTLAFVGGPRLRVTFGTRFKPVGVHASACMYDDFYTTPNLAAGAPGAWLNYQIGCVAPRNQPVLIAAFPNSFEIFFWLNDFNAAPPRHYPVASQAQLTTALGSYELYVDFWGQVEIIGENADVA